MKIKTNQMKNNPSLLIEALLQRSESTLPMGEQGVEPVVPVAPVKPKVRAVDHQAPGSWAEQFKDKNPTDMSRKMRKGLPLPGGNNKHFKPS